VREEAKIRPKKSSLQLTTSAMSRSLGANQNDYVECGNAAVAVSSE
tara:strand:+ start:482 stop:619 length:138 start_codon:yes stop_codon:yes gene_type:complete